MEKVRKGVGGCLKRLRADALKVDEAKGTTGRVSVAVDEQMSVGRSGRTGREERGRGEGWRTLDQARPCAVNTNAPQLDR